MFQREFVFWGKHALYTNNLKDSAESAGLFERNLDILIMGPIIGLLYGKKSKMDKEGNHEAKVFTEQLLGEKDILDFVYKLIILLDTSEGLTTKEKVYRAFKIDEEAVNLSEEEKEILSENRKLFESYLLGGLEYLHERLYGDGTYDATKMLDGLYEFIKEFYEDLQVKNCETEDILAKLN